MSDPRPGWDRDTIVGWAVWTVIGGVGCAGLLAGLLLLLGAAPILAAAFPITTLGAAILIGLALWGARKHRREKNDR